MIKFELRLLFPKNCTVAKEGNDGILVQFGLDSIESIRELTVLSSSTV